MLFALSHFSFQVAKLIYNSKCLSVRPSVLENSPVVFQERRLKIFVKIPLTIDRLFYIILVRLFVGYDSKEIIEPCWSVTQNSGSKVSIFPTIFATY